MQIDPTELSGSDRYRLLVSAVVPRPIAFVSTVGPTGAVNLAPFSYFNAITSSPMLVSICIGKRTWEGERIKKDTLRNIEATGELVINVATEALIDAVNQSSAGYPPNTSELEALGLTAVPSERIAAPRVGESPVQLECRLERVIELGEPPHVSMVIAEVLLAHVRDELWDADACAIDGEKLQPLARMGGTYYAFLGDLPSRERP